MKRNFKHFVYSVSAIVIPILLLFQLLAYLGYAPLFTNSISFDAKINYIQKRKVGQINLMAIGSSITLNNLSSKVISESLTNSYFNFSCWGLQIGDTKKLIINYLPKYKPKYILICSSTPDFTTAGNLESITNYINTNDYLKERFKAYFYLKNYSSLLDIIIRKRDLKKYTATNDNYTSLNFDQDGGALLNIPQKNISAERWNEKSGFPTPFTVNQYNELSSLCTFLAIQKIKLIFVQSPIKKDFFNTLIFQKIVFNHFQICRKLVEEKGGIYLNLSDTKVFADDKLFVDQFHLSSIGADLFTHIMVDKLKNIKELNNFR